MLVAGVDEAGRGSVIGPLVIGGIVFQDSQIPNLKELGVKDSKALTPRRRAVLSKEVKRIAVQWEVLKVSPSEVDKVVLEGKKFHRLNRLEVEKMAKVIRKLHPDVVYVDASDVNETRFAKQIRAKLPFAVKIISEHHADVNYAMVSAASIVAKVHRDDAVALLRERYGDFGSGYPSDSKTTQFLVNLVREGGSIPDYIRKSWKTVKRLIEKEK